MTQDRFARWLAVDPEALYSGIRWVFPTAPARVLDIGAGAGRDAAWLTALGYGVTCAEPDSEAFQRGRVEAPDARWVRAALPSLPGISGQFDLVLVSAVWHMLSPSDQAPSLRRLAELMTLEGVAILSLKQAMDRTFSLSDAAAGEAGLRVDMRHLAGSQQPGNAALGVTWEWVVLRRAAA